MFTQTATGSCTNTTTQTTITSTGVGSLTLPANFFIAGRTLKIEGMGYHSSTGNPSITIRVKLGSTTIATLTGSSGNGSNDTFRVSGVITCRTTGASGTVFPQLEYDEIQHNGLTAGSDGTAAVTIDTTINQALTITAQWGTANAGNTINLTNLTVVALN
jgi:hypothetical protein